VIHIETAPLFCVYPVYGTNFQKQANGRRYILKKPYSLILSFWRKTPYISVHIVGSLRRCFWRKTPYISVHIGGSLRRCFWRKTSYISVHLGGSLRRCFWRKTSYISVHTGGSLRRCFWRKTSYISVHLGGSLRQHSACRRDVLRTICGSVVAWNTDFVLRK
jgi:3-dehydroquinate dehydratase